MGIRGELYSNRVILPNRTYFFNVKENRMGDLYLNIVESKNRETSGFDRQSVVLFADDLQEFLKGFDESLRVLEKAVREKRRSSAGEGPKRGERPERGERHERDDMPPREGPERRERHEYGERPPRGERPERGERYGRSDRPPRGGPPRGDRYEHREKFGRDDMPPRGERYGRDDKPPRGEKYPPRPGSDRPKKFRHDEDREGRRRVVVKKGKKRNEE